MRPVSRWRIVVGRPEEPRVPGTTQPSRSPKYRRTWSACRAGCAPAGLAEVETNGPPHAAASALITGCSVTLTATVSCAPQIQSGTRPLWGTNQVAGPGQLAARVSSCGRGRSCSRNCSCSVLWATRMRPLATGRAFKASSCSTASLLAGSQLKPQTASVGQAITSPCSRARQADVSARALGGVGKLTL